MNKLLAHFFILATIFFGLYGQLMLKWQVNRSGAPPTDWAGKVEYIFSMLINPWVWTSLLAAFLGMLTWMLAIARTDLSYAYPFTSLSFVLILVASAIFFNEPISTNKVLGMILIVVGIMLGSR
jgi:multidrug transporter EmrE-like cation transporter